MGGRYGGDIGRGRGTSWSRKRALEAVGQEARRAFGWKPKQPDDRERGRAQAN